MEKDKKELSTKTIVGVIIVLTIIILFILCISFVLYKNSQKQKREVKTDTEIVSIIYAKDESGINMKNYIPLTDEVGKKLDNKEHYFDFNIKSKKNNNVSISYELALRKDDKCNLENKQIKVYLEKENEGTYVKSFNPKVFKALKKKSEVGTPKGSMILLSDNIVDSINDKYRLRVWVDENASISSPVQCHILLNIYAKVIK